MKQEKTNERTTAAANTVAEPAILKIRGLKKSFGEQTVLDGLDLDLNPGENLVVLGKSGSGKSVLIKLVVALLPADEGTIEVFGNDVLNTTREQLAEIRTKIGFLFQGGALYDSMTVRGNLEFPLKRMKPSITKEEREAKIVSVLEHVGLSDVLDKMPADLSGGMRKRLALARTVVVDPALMLYDEPTTGLDPVTSGEISELILKIREQYKTASVIITHDIACALRVADRMIMLHDGNVHRQGTADDFLHEDDELVRSFFNSLKV
jgi:phospholipid/cholesterol/gamma-HCH transport system ATP-binding protein